MNFLCIYLGEKGGGVALMYVYVWEHLVSLYYRTGAGGSAYRLNDGRSLDAQCGLKISNIPHVSDKKHVYSEFVC